MNLAHRSEKEMTQFLAKHFAPPHYAFLSQVRNGTGFARKTTRTADGLAMSLWPSRGIHLNGIEIKVSHSDFVSEIRNPEKAEDIARFCHYWWICAPNVKVAPVAELPANWGLLVLDDAGEKLVVEKAAVFNPNAAAPDWLMLASILRNAAEASIPLASLAQWKSDVESKVRLAEQDARKRELDRLGEKAKELIAKEEKLRAVFSDYSSWDIDGFVARYKLASRLMNNSRQVRANLEFLVKGVEKLKPLLAELKTGEERKDGGG